MEENYDIIAGYYEEKKELEDICKLLIDRKELIEYGGTGS